MNVNLRLEGGLDMSYEEVKHWFISSDNLLVHVKTDCIHAVFPVSKIVYFRAHQ